LWRWFRIKRQMCGLVRHQVGKLLLDLRRRKVLCRLPCRLITRRGASRSRPRSDALGPIHLVALSVYRLVALRCFLLRLSCTTFAHIGGCWAFPC
jgi:hypothetical protein